MPSFKILNAPKSLDMQDFRSISHDYEGLLRSCKFAVGLRPVGSEIRRWGTFCRDFTYLCEVAEFPGRGFMNLDLRYYGPSFKIPYQTSYEDTTLTFLCRTGSFERQFFDDWMQVINPLNTFDFNYRDEYFSEIDIFQFADIENEDPNEDTSAAVYFVTLHNAYPLLINPQPITWADDQFLRLAVSFTYTHWSRGGHDTTPNYNKDLVLGRPNIGRPENFTR